jgi:transposase
VIPPGVEIFLALAPIDLRWGFDRLAGLVESQLGRRPRSGALFVFFGKRRTALKVLHYDGSGLCLYYKRLDRGSFRIPEAFEEGATSSYRSLEHDERSTDSSCADPHRRGRHDRVR